MLLAEIKEHPITGLGVGIPWQATAAPLSIEHEEGRDYVHFAALWFWLKLGVLGLCAYVAIMIGCIVLAWQAWRRLLDPWLRAFALASVCGIAGLIVMDTTASFTGVEARFTVVLAAQVGLLALLARGADPKGAGGTPDGPGHRPDLTGGELGVTVSAVAAAAGPQNADETPLLEDLRARLPRVAIVHEWLTVPGGSEQVVLELLEMFPAAELFTSIYDPEPWPRVITERPVHTSALNRIPGATRHYPKLLPLMDRAFRSFDLSGFDLVISSNHACAKNVHTPKAALHVCYCHTPMRYAWEESFMEGEELGRLARLALPRLLRHLRKRDLAGAASPDVFVANSRHVAERIARYYGRSGGDRPSAGGHRALPRRSSAPAARPISCSAGWFPTSGSTSPWRRASASVVACRWRAMAERCPPSAPRQPGAATSSSSVASTTPSATACSAARGRCCFRARRTSGSCPSRPRPPACR